MAPGLRIDPFGDDSPQADSELVEPAKASDICQPDATLNTASCSEAVAALTHHTMKEMKFDWKERN